MDELTLDGETYISTKRAAKITGYAKDYVGQLCREGRVNARSVGRNWYVLESSIREHRFGAEVPVKNQNTQNLSSEGSDEASDTAWQASQYAHEPVSELPMVNKEPAHYVDLDTLESDSSYLESSEVVQEMQNAWQDWFRRENQDNIAKETLLEEPDEDEAAPTLPEVAETAPAEEAELAENDEETPIFLHKEIEEEPVPVTYEAQEAPTTHETEEEEQIPIYRSYARPEPIQKPQLPLEQRMYDYNPAPTQALATRSRISKANRKARRNTVVIREGTKGSMLWRVVIVLVMLVVVVLTIIGSGVLDQYLNQASLKYFPIQFIGGERVLNK